MLGCVDSKSVPGTLNPKPYLNPTSSEAYGFCHYLDPKSVEEQPLVGFGPVSNLLSQTFQNPLIKE